MKHLGSKIDANGDNCFQEVDVKGIWEIGDSLIGEARSFQIRKRVQGFSFNLLHSRTDC